MNKAVTYPLCASHLSIWTNPENAVEIIDLPDKCIDELTQAAKHTTDESFSFTDKLIPALTHSLELAEHVRSRLLFGSGAVIINTFPVSSRDVATTRRAAAIFGSLISPLMEQDIKGTRLYDVIDEGENASTTRRSKTNEEQPFHTDGPWFTAPPALIGLFCIQPAAVGGFSQVSSLQKSFSTHIDSPATLELLNRDLPWNKMGEHTSDEAAYRSLPILETTGDGELLIRHYADYVRSGHQLADAPIKDEIKSLLSNLDDDLSESACEPFRLEEGQLQYVNNWTVAHARSSFDDQSVSSTGRHLVRLWNTPVKST